MYNIHLLPASFGDSILIEYGEDTPQYILIDGGPFNNYEEMKVALQAVAPDLKKLELLVVTHIDIDHIDGIIKLLRQDELPFPIKQVWFNGYDQIKEKEGFLGELQGEYLSELIKKHGIPHNTSFDGNAVVVNDYNHLPVIPLTGGMKLTLLSPGTKALEKLHKAWKKYLLGDGKDLDFAKELEGDARYDGSGWLGGDTPIPELAEKEVDKDDSVPNLSSIAFIATFQGKSCLFAGDATSDALLEAIEPILKQTGEERLTIDAWKLAHHCSKKSNLDKLMQKINCKKILVSSDGARYKHPDAICIAKVITNNGPGLKFYFNYKTKHNNRWADPVLQHDYKFKSNYPAEGEHGITIKLI